MKRFLRILGICVAVLVVVLLVLNWQLGNIITSAVNTVGPSVLKVPVHVQEVQCHIFRGKLHIKNLVLGNPEGFSEPSMFVLGELVVSLAPASLFSNTIHIKEILITAPQITFEQTLRGNNIGALQKNLESEPPKEEANKPAQGKSQKKVVIDHVLVSNGKITLKMGVGGSLPLPDIELKDIGKNDPNGTSIVGAVKEILGAIVKSITTAVSSSGKLAVDGAKKLGTWTAGQGKDLGKGAVDTGKAVGDAASSAVKGVMNVFGGKK